MKETAHFLKIKGLTLVEPLLVVAILALLFGLGTPYLWGNKEKTILQTEQEKITNVLKTAQQKAIAAYGGYAYKVRFGPPFDYYLETEPGVNSTAFSLYEKVRFDSVNPNEVIFAKLTGKPNAPLRIILASKRFKVEINVSPNGLVTTTPPEKK